jgi:hypothetical protein
MNKRSLALGLLAGLLLLPSLSFALEMRQKALVGLKGVYVLVEYLRPGAELQGLTENQIQRVVEQRLRQAGINILTADESLKQPGKSYLYVHVNTYYEKDFCQDYLAYRINVTLKEWVTLARGGQTPAGIWQDGGVGLAHIKHVVSEILGRVGDEIDDFLRDYRAANPNK